MDPLGDWMQQLDQDFQYSGGAPGIRGANEETHALWGGDVPGQGGTCPLVEPTEDSLEKEAGRQQADGCHHYIHVSLVLSSAPCGELEFEQRQTVTGLAPPCVGFVALGKRHLIS